MTLGGEKGEDWNSQNKPNLVGAQLKFIEDN